MIQVRGSSPFVTLNFANAWDWQARARGQTRWTQCQPVVSYRRYSRLVRAFAQSAYRAASGIPDESHSRLSGVPDRGTRELRR